MYFFFCRHHLGLSVHKDEQRMHEGTETTPPSLAPALTCWHLNTAERKELFIAFVFYLYVDEVNSPEIAQCGEQIVESVKLFRVAGSAATGTIDSQPDG